MTCVSYLDYNVIAGIAGVPQRSTAAEEAAAIAALRTNGTRFALSAWTAYELAKSVDFSHVAKCAAFVESLQPLWVSDPGYLVRREMSSFLAQQLTGDLPRPVPALHETMGQMWSTFGIHVANSASFTQCVTSLRAQSQNLTRIAGAAKMASEAVTTGRKYIGDKEMCAQIDREYFAARLGCRSDDLRVEFLMKHIPELYRQCPTIAIEDELMKIRTRDSFKPSASHSADLQHALSALGYCSHFVTDDGQLRNHAEQVVRRLRLRCRVVRYVTDVLCTD